MRDNGPSDLSEGGSDYRVADYEPLLTRAVAALPSTSTVATRLAIYERARKAQLAQLRTVRPALPEIDVAREEKALDQAIALIEASFGGTDSTSLAGVVLSGAGAEKSTSWLWLVLASVLSAVLVIAGAAIVMRQKPQYLAVTQPEAPQELASWQPATIAEQAQPSPNSTAPAASAPPGSQPIAQSGADPASHGPDASSPAVPGMAQAAILIASDNPRNPLVSLGSTVWSTIPAEPGKPATAAVKADVDIPDLKVHATMTLRKSTDPTLQATHTIDLKFSFADGAPITGVKDVEPKVRNLGSTASEALTGVRVKISDAYFLIALAKGEEDAARNLDLIQTRAWLDFALLLNDNRIAKLVFQKSAKGEAMLAKAFKAWK
jgi:hypothetical protein